MKPPSFDVAVIVRNEAKTLPKLVASLKGFQDRGGQIYVLDTGSTDYTPQIARSLGCQVTEVGNRFRRTITEKEADEINAWFVVGDEDPVVNAGDSLFVFCDARNHAAWLGKNDMVAMPDADEAYTVLDLDRVEKDISEGADQLDYNFIFSHDAQGNPGLKFRHCKFYNRKKMEWRRIVHENIYLKDGVVAPKRVLYGDEIILLEHFQNSETNRGAYLTGLAVDVWENKDDDRATHYLAREMMYRGRPKSALKLFQRHVDMRRWPAERAQSFIFMGECWRQLADFEKEEEMYFKAWQIEPNRRIAMIKLAEKAFRENDPMKARGFVEAMMHIPHSGFYSDDISHYTWWPHHIGAWACWHTGDMEAAKAHWKKAIAFSPNNPILLDNAKFFSD